MNGKDWVLRLTVGVLCLLWSSGIAQCASPVQANTPAVPEFFLTTADQPHCVLHVSLLDHTKESRYRDLMNFMNAGFRLTSGWKHSFIPVVVDYVDFHYVNLISFARCPREVRKPDIALGLLPRRSSVSVLPDDGFVDTEKDRVSFRSIAAMFRAYHSPYSVSDCAIRLTILDKTGRSDLPIQNALGHVWAKYRFSIAEIWQVNAHLYIIFSRQCDQKKDLYANLTNLLERDYHKAKEQLGAPEVAPDLAEYRQSRPG